MLEGVATRQEIETWYSITDVVEMNEALDAKMEAEAKARQQR